MGKTRDGSFRMPGKEHEVTCGGLVAMRKIAPPEVSWVIVVIILSRFILERFNLGKIIMKVPTQ